MECQHNRVNIPVARASLRASAGEAHSLGGMNVVVKS
jgi:hypothetical protein